MARRIARTGFQSDQPERSTYNISTLIRLIMPPFTININSAYIINHMCDYIDHGYGIGVASQNLTYSQQHLTVYGLGQSLYDVILSDR